MRDARLVVVQTREEDSCEVRILLCVVGTSATSSNTSFVMLSLQKQSWKKRVEPVICTYVLVR